MKKNLVFNAFYSKSLTSKGVNVKKSSYSSYLKNSFVSLASAKMNSDDNTDVAIVTNTPLQAPFDALFKKYGIKNIIVDFDDFRLPEEYKWSYAYYKLCALKTITQTTAYDNYLLLDTDTLSTLSINNIWKEMTQDKIVLYDLRLRYSHGLRALLMESYKNVYGSDENITFFGGEMIGGSKAALIKFTDILKEVFDDLYKSHLLAKNAGDEIILSIAAYQYQYNNIVNAGGYLQRFWTGSFYKVSTQWKNDAICIWHLPAEKERGMLILYNYIVKHGQLPRLEKMARIVSLPPATHLFSLAVRSLCQKISLKLAKE